MCYLKPRLSLTDLPSTVTALFVLSAVSFIPTGLRGKTPTETPEASDSPEKPEAKPKKLLDSYASFQPLGRRLEKQLLPEVCETELTQARSGDMVCEGCPFFTGHHGEEYGALKLTAGIPGHFTGPDRTEVFVNYVGCDAHVVNGGGVMLFRRGMRIGVQYMSGSVSAARASANAFPFNPGSLDWYASQCTAKWESLIVGFRLSASMRLRA